MTMEEALTTMGATLDDWLDKKNMEHLINKIFDEHEAQLKAKDEEINTLMKENKTLNNLIELFMNEWYRCGRLPDTTDELILIDNVYEKMFEKLFKDNA